jgi:hypothetical protein
MTTKLGEDIRKAMMGTEDPDEPVTIIGESPDPEEPEKDQDGVIIPEYERVPAADPVP